MTLAGVGYALAQGVVPGQVIQSGGTNASGQAIGQSVLSLLGLGQAVVSTLVPLLIGVGVIALFVGVIGFMFGKKDGGEHEKWAKFMGMAILGLFVMVSIWGIVNFLGSIVGVGQGGGVPVPCVPGSTRC